MTSHHSSWMADFLSKPLLMEPEAAHRLSRKFSVVFRQLAAEAPDQFLATPISESILRPVGKTGRGRHLAIDIGGTNLRVGFVELSGEHVATNGSTTEQSTQPTLQLLKERKWSIAEHAKNGDRTSLFTWVGECIAVVIAEAVADWALPSGEAIPLGITFSFPMVQNSLSEAKVMAMGKGFINDGEVDLASLLREGYEKARGGLPPIKIVAIANDSVSTLVSFIYSYGETSTKKGCMGLIVGTGCNATIPLELQLLHESKRPRTVSLLPGESIDNVRIAVNTEWSINGSAPPLRELGLLTRWDEILDENGEKPGFQPLEYMTSGRYLSELARLIFIDYLEHGQGVSPSDLPPPLRQRFGLEPTFLSHFKPHGKDHGAAQLDEALPLEPGTPFAWNPASADALWQICKSIQVRASGIVAAGIIALLKLGGDFPSTTPASSPSDPVPRDTPLRGTARPVRILGVGYTGGCIAHFQDYLADTQRFLDKLVERELGPNTPVRVELTPCHDGGIIGAGILAAAAEESQDRRT